MGVAQDVEKYSEGEIVKKLSQHHDLDIRFTVKSQNIKDRKTLMNLLQCKDVETRRNRWPRHDSAQDKPAPAGVPQERKPQETTRTPQQTNNWRRLHEVKKNRHNENENKSYPKGPIGAFPKKVDVHVIDRGLQPNPEQACGMSTEN